MNKYIISFLFLAACSQQPSESIVSTSDTSTNVVYGEDGRKDLSEITDPQLLQMARSTVAFMDAKDLVYDSVFNKYNFENTEPTLPFCTTEKFRNQPHWADCSGTLIAEDLILTAGHCVPTNKDCAQAKIVFDYSIPTGQKNVNTISGDNVFSCKKVVAFSNLKLDTDFAIIQLDRPVVGRKPLEFSTTELTYKSPLMLIGHPEGLPTKITFNGKVRSLIPDHYFTASLDAFSGNSGSAVYNENTKKIVGILVRDQRDYERKNGCYIAKQCDENDCRGEDVTRISEVLKFLTK